MVRVPAGPFPGEDSPWFADSCLLPACTQGQPSVCVCAGDGGEVSPLLSLLMWVLVPSWSPTLMTSSDPKPLPNAPSPCHHIRVQGFDMAFWGQPSRL